MPSARKSNGSGPVRRNFSGNAPRKAGSVRTVFATLIAASIGLALVAVSLSQRVMRQHNAATATGDSAPTGVGRTNEPPARRHQKHAKDHRREQARDAIVEKHEMKKQLRAGGNAPPPGSDSMEEDSKAQAAQAKSQAAAINAVGKPHVDEHGMITPPHNPDHDGHRVYCMIPFIWNQPIYAAIMETWGKRCDEIYFLTDSIVGGELKGDVIGKDDAGFKPYWEYPANTFPDNVIFVNMTRTWNDCPETTDRRGKKAKKGTCLE